MVLQKAAILARTGARAWKGMLEARPLVTKTVASFALFSAGELSAQVIMSEARKPEGDTARLSGRASDIEMSQVAAFGCLAFYNAPVMHGLFRLAARQSLSASTTVMLTSCVAIPANVSVAMLLSALSKGTTPEQSFEMVRAGYLTTVERALCVWPTIHFLNIYCVPLQCRLAVFASGAYLWNTYFCCTMHRANAALKETGEVQREAAQTPAVLGWLMKQADLEPRETDAAYAEAAHPEEDEEVAPSQKAMRMCALSFR